MESDCCAMCGSGNVERAPYAWNEVLCNDCGHAGKPEESW